MRLGITAAMLALHSSLAHATTDQTTFFLSNVTSYRELSKRTLQSGIPLPTLANESEANLRFKTTFGSGSGAQGDLSQLLRYGSRYRLVQDEEVVNGAPPSRTQVLSLQINELYANHNVTEDLQISAGKKRVVWGSGAAVNPGDVLNPPKSSNDPNQVREGAWLVQADLSSETAQLSLVASADVRNDEQGLPRKILHFSRNPAEERDAHYLAAAKIYVLFQETDLVGAVVYSHKYGEDEHRNLKLVGSFSKVLANVCEVHGEALVHDFDDGPETRFVLGARYMQWEKATLTGEWSHQTDGGSDHLIASATFTEVGHEDVKLVLSTTNSLEDGSGSYASKLGWSARESLELNLGASGNYAPYRGWGRTGGKGHRVVESDASPVLYQISFEMKAFL